MGNDRVKLIAADDGYVTLFGDERGPVLYNRFAEDQQNLGGGFSYVKDGGDVYATMFKYAPSSARTWLRSARRSASCSSACWRSRIRP